MKRRVALGTLLAFALAGGLPARSHEGHDEAPGGAAPAAAGRHTLTAVSDRYELVLKNDPLRPGLKTDLDVYLSDFRTNAPIDSAAISLSLRGGGSELWAGTCRPVDGRPGVYAVAFEAPADSGSFSVLVTVRRGGTEERFALRGLEVTDAGAEPPVAATPGRLLPWIGGGSVLAMIALVLVVRRRTRAHPAAAALVLLLVAGASAHEGHDDAPSASGAAVGPGAQVYVSKESQFLLRIRTEPVQPEPVQKRLTVLGRVAPRGGGEVEIIAPQPGRIRFENGRAPVMGQGIGRDQTLARLTIVDDLILRSPLDGVITGVFVVDGQLVAAGQKLVTLLDPSVVWVHADVYEADVPVVQESTRAVITSQAMPDLLLSGRRVAMGVTQGEVLGTVEAWFEVPNAGRRLKIGALVEVGIEVGNAEPLLVLPRGAVFDKDGRKLVFVHTAPERFTVHEVTLGTSLGARTAVTGDLAPGDRVVTGGGYPLLTAPVVSLGR